ncbi:uncharacterized protein LOC143024746 [Oratosquilla oratoria]|uniref:uncharacterized protein LOC143024746 n=1 Tax=Oratosquilla oratoria TaxID=337810 RepID=UPI003F774213
MNRGRSIMNSFTLLPRITQYFARNTAGVLRQYRHPIHVQINLNAQHKSTNSVEEIDTDAPIKFSSSRAATWKARDTYGGGKEKKGLWITSTQHLILPQEELNYKWLCGPTLSRKMFCQCKPVSLQQHRTITGWDQKRHKEVPRYQTIIVTLSVASFLGYFLWFREPSDIDEQMSRPIWERLPGIDPERAEVMMELDRRLGLQADYEALAKYKEEYYAKQAEELERSRKILEDRQKGNQTLLLEEKRRGSHTAILKDYVNKENRS